MSDSPMSQSGGPPRLRWTLTACPECGLQAPLGYECSGGGDCGTTHSLNVPVVEMAVMLVRSERAVTNVMVEKALVAVDRWQSEGRDIDTGTLPDVLRVALEAALEGFPDA